MLYDIVVHIPHRKAPIATRYWEVKPAFCMIPLPVSGLKLFFFFFPILMLYFKAPSGQNML